MYSTETLKETWENPIANPYLLFVCEPLVKQVKIFTVDTLFKVSVYQPLY